MKIKYRVISLLLVFMMSLGFVNVTTFADTEEDTVIKIEGTTFFEAEVASVMMSPMSVSKDSESSGGYYVSPVSGSSSNTSPQRNFPHLTYKVSVPKDDAYYVWMRVRTTDTAKYYMCFDDGVYKEQVNLEKPAEKKGEWVWVCDDKYWLNAGEHELKVRYCSRTMHYDAFYITNDYKFTPEGADTSILSPYEIYERDDNGNVIDPHFTLPTYLPPSEHPRILFRKSDIEKIKANLNHEQNAAAYETLLQQAEYKTDGIMPELQYGKASNIDLNVALMIEANAFLYQLTGDKAYGLKAIKTARNYMESCMVDKSNDTSTGRTMMMAIWSAALCYDWCYDLLTDDDKDFLIFHMLYNSKYSEVGYLPTSYVNVSVLIGHILEFQLLGALSAVAIATYDEIPDYYNVVMGRIQQDIIPAVNRFNQDSTYLEGSAYGMYRHYYEVLNNYLFKGMGYDNVYYEEGLSTLSYMYTRQPDGELFAVGDEYNYNKTGYVSADSNVLFLLGNICKNPYIKTEFWRGSRKDVKTSTQPGHVDPVLWLIVNDVDVPCDKSARNFPLTTYSGDDTGYMYARTSWDEGFEANTVVALMNLKTHYLLGHQHKDVGHFSLYHKGLLALDAGAYEGTAFTNSAGTYVNSIGYGSNFHKGFVRQSIAHNTMLVYDPNEMETAPDKTAFVTYDGGQRMTVTNHKLVMGIDEFDSDNIITGEVLAYNWGPDLNNPVYSYMKGDITKAYNDKVEEYQRSFMFFNLEDETYPAALVIFDAIRSSSPTFKKTWLLNSETEPIIDGNSVTIARDSIDYAGRLVNQTLLPSNGFTINKSGQDFDGINKYMVNGVLYEMKPKAATAEVGNWRTEISPTKAEKQNYFLNVIQVGENDDNIAPLEAKLVEETDIYVGAEIKNHVAYFRKDGLSKAKNFTINPGKSSEERFFAITGLAAGKWTVYDENGKQIAQEYAYEKHDSISFKGTGGKFTLKYNSVSGLQTPDYTVFGLATDDKKSIDVNIDGYYETFDNVWYEENGVIYVPVVETLQRLDVEGVTASATSVNVNSDLVKHDFTIGNEGVVTKDNILYAPADLMADVVDFKLVYDKVASIASVTYGNRTRDKAKVYRYNDPAIAQIATAYTEGETTASAFNSLDNDTASYSCTLGEGSFIAILEKPSTISKIALFWISGAKRQEIFEMYVSEDGENWTEVFAGRSDGKTDGFEYHEVGGDKQYKYVKLVCHGNSSSTYNSLAEIIVYK